MKQKKQEETKLNMKLLKKQIDSFAAAINGIVESISQEFHLKIHLIAIICVVFLGFYMSISKTEWLFLILTMSAVVCLEIVNSAIERLCDKVTKENDPLIKLAKDMAAGSVLIAAISSVIIGCIIFIPKFIDL
ncbi:MAG: diacylglycerol kinase family protein [Flavobacteriales bacterium]|jgi:undecaprenol kinase